MKSLTSIKQMQTLTSKDARSTEIKSAMNCCENIKFIQTNMTRTTLWKRVKVLVLRASLHKEYAFVIDAKSHLHEKPHVRLSQKCNDRKPQSAINWPILEN